MLFGKDVRNLDIKVYGKKGTNCDREEKRIFKSRKKAGVLTPDNAKRSATMEGETIIALR